VAEKISKTSRAGLGDKAAHSAKSCPKCGTVMVATRVIKMPNRPGGMYWICPKDDYREKI
jgi:hypothetical protein